MYQKWVKRIVDVLFSFIGLFLLLPLLSLLTLLLFVVYKKNPFFIQKRTGKKKKVFKIIKFKTMNDERNNEGVLLADEQRIIPLGNFLRKTSLDELPQLFNVLKGDMSLIGPRPLLIDYMYLYSEFEDQRHLVKPGITGWVQVNGRNSLSWDKRFELDVYYVENSSFLLDVKIVFKTIMLLFKKEKVILKNNIPIEPFEGLF